MALFHDREKKQVRHTRSSKTLGTPGKMTLVSSFAVRESMA